MYSLYIDNKLQGGLRDYTRHFIPEGDQLFNHENNIPVTFSFELYDLDDEAFIVPTRGAYVTFEDNRFESRDTGVPDGYLFSGYVSDDPEPIFLGRNSGESVWKYRIIATSEEYLLQLKQIPPKIYVNKTRGFIIRDIVQEMFLNADFQGLETSGVLDGGTERLYQTDTLKKFADVLAEFAKADAYRYRVLNGRLFYEPEGELLPGASDPLVKLTIDEEDPRYTPSNLMLERVATSIANDVTVLGSDEPTTLVNESYVSDGYQGEHQLLFPPYGLAERILVEDDLTAPTLDTGLWQEEDDELALTGVGDGSYLQLFEGSFNIVGGAGTPEAPATWLRSRRGIELSGILNFRDGEIFVAPGTFGLVSGNTGTGIIGGLFTDEDMKMSNCFSGWIVNSQYESVSPIINGVEPVNPSGSGFWGSRYWHQIDINGDMHHILRRRFEFDIPTGLPTTRRGPRETDVVFGEGESPQVNGCTVTYIVEKHNFVDPQNVIITKQEIYSTRLENVPEFVLYAPIVSYDLHLIMNFVKAWRPQQVRVEVNGITAPTGDFIDGGLCEVSSDGDRHKLSWYSVPTSAPPTPGPVTPPSTSPYALWKLGESGEFVVDTGTAAVHHMRSVGPITTAPASPSSSTDLARYFPGSTISENTSLIGPWGGGLPLAAPSTGAFPIPFSITGWLKTTQADGPIWVHMSVAQGYVGVWVQNGRISCRLSFPENQVTGTTVVNDGNWHHFAVTHDAVAFAAGTTKIYVDGVLNGSGTQTCNTPQAAFSWAIGYDNVYWPSINATIETWYTGYLDEIALWTSALTAESVAGLFLSPAPASGAPPASYNPQTGATIPPQGSRIDITYYRSQQAKARVRSTTSIMSERGKFGDDGIRQHTIMPEDVFPVPRTSAECQYLAQAYLADRAQPRYEGSYTFDTGEDDITRLDILPAPGDLIPCDVPLPNGDYIDANLHCTAVQVQFAGEGAYTISTSFGPRNRFDEAQRKLLLSRRSSLDNPEIRDNDVLVAEVLNSTGYAVPSDPRDVLVSSVTPLTFTVNMNPSRVAVVGGYGAGGGTAVNGDLPDGVVGYEVRKDDSGWGAANYVARVSSATFALNRGTRDRAYFVRPFNAQGNYSRHSALVRVISPLSNTLVATGLDGDISGDMIRLYIPILRNPDIGGWLVQKTNADGPVLYQGNGIDHRTIVSGATVLIESGRATISFPISTAAYTVRVLVYNLLGEFGPGTLFTITRPAPTI